MSNFWRLIGVCAVTASLVACGGGDDPEADDGGGTDTVNTTPVSGSFATCDRIGEPAALASMRTTMAFNTSGATLTQSLHVGTGCSSSATFAVVTFPAVTILDGGTKSVNGPNGGTATARQAIFGSAAGNLSYTVSPGIEAGVSNGNLIIQDANSTTVLFNVPVARPASSDKDVFIRYNGTLYFGGTALDANDYPTTIDYTDPWVAL